MPDRRDQFGMIILCCATLIISGCGSGGGTGDFAAAIGASCSSNKMCPIADAGPDRTVVVGTQTTLDGSASSSGTTGLITYQWTLTSQPAGSTATLTNAVSASPTFTADFAGFYVVSLTANDGQMSSLLDTKHKW